jgi:hypothetical protein
MSRGLSRFNAYQARILATNSSADTFGSQRLGATPPKRINATFLQHLCLHVIAEISLIK